MRFRAMGGSYSVVLTDAGADFVFGDTQRVIGLRLRDQNPNPSARGLEPLRARTNYLIGNRKQDWRFNVPQFGRVRYTGVYDGIDLDFYGNRGRLEYDFIVHPGADPRRIRLEFSGASRVSLTRAGDLIVRAGKTSFIEKKPRVYQPGGSTVNGRYRLVGRRAVAIDVAGYDHSRDLIIDPVMVYASLAGGPGADQINAVQIDASGMIYVAGAATAAAFSVPDQAFQTSSNGGTDAFVAKIDPTVTGAASLLYFTYLGGSGSDSANALAVDSAGVVYLTGSTNSSNFPLAGTPVQSGFGGGMDAFVAKLDPSLNGSDALLYSVYLGGSDTDVGNGIAVDNSHVIYVAGTTRSDQFPVTGSAYAGIKWGPQDAFIAKINPAADAPLLYSSYFGGEDDDDGRALALSPSGSVYLGGSTLSTQLPLAGSSYRSTSQGSIDLFVAQFDLNKTGVDSLVYATYFGGSDAEELRGMALDSKGRLLLTGYTLSNDFPTTPDAYQSSGSKTASAFVTRLDLSAPKDSALSYSTYLGGSQGEVGYGIAAGAAQTIYITGYTLSPDFPTTPDAFQKDPNKGVAVFVTRLDTAQSGSAQLSYSTYLGSSGIHVGRAIALARNGILYVGGATSSSVIVSGPIGFQTDFAGGLSDGFIIAIAP